MLLQTPKCVFLPQNPAHNLPREVSDEFRLIILNACCQWSHSQQTDIISIYMPTPSHASRCKLRVEKDLVYFLFCLITYSY